MSKPRDPLSTALVIGLVRASPVIVLGCLYLWMRESLRAKMGGTLDWFAPPLFLITASYIVARTVIRRRTLLPASRRYQSEDSDAGPSFDPDVALERYLANKDTDRPPPLVTRDIAAPAPLRDQAAPAARGGFGRKGVRP